ncbi:MAG: ATP-dependent DNA helicase RecG [Alphaproteobacteria bacterium]
MRPQILYPLFTSIEKLQGVGSTLGKKLEKIGLVRIIDLLWHLPTKVQDRRYMPKISEAQANVIATLKVRVDGIEKPHNPRQPWRIGVSDGTGQMVISYFKASESWIIKNFPIGEVRVVSGHLDFWHGQLQMSHPDYIGSIDDMAYIAKLHPIWPLTAGITNKFMGRLVTQALERLEDFEEWQDKSWLKKNEWPSFKNCLYELQNPSSTEVLTLSSLYRRRLAYDEILAHQLALLLLRKHIKSQNGIAIKGNGEKVKEILAHLPFELTDAQRRSLKEILLDMRQPSKMVRLLQGDVGSGKTMVALFAMVTATEAGLQACMMAPTEILARQHYKVISTYAQKVGVHTILLTGREKGKKRQEILEQIASGKAQIIIGTHALLQDDVLYHNLALAVIDEQHRFGVQQRVTLTAKGKAVDLLVMTATPIPRSLMLSMWGDMESSKLDEKPQGRKDIATRALPSERLGDVVQAIGRAMTNDAKVYWVCPLVEESEKSDMIAAEDRYQQLKEFFGEEKVHLVHGKMKAKEKDEAMAAFKDGGASILVATTVIEVGVDVPEATVMVIEHAERFGLSQLHQLRGRVGRDNSQSSCLLVYHQPISHVAKERLKILRKTNDGFLIAEKDLELRGSGDLLGTKQSGLPEFKFVDLEAHRDLLFAAADDVQLILNQDPELKSERGQALRILLYLFERDAAASLLSSG